jgi:CheY-like chemotaxis protein
MDIHLSGKMRGTEAAKILWEQFGIPIVYLTAYADEESINAAKPSMPYAYVVKPYQPAAGKGLRVHHFLLIVGNCTFAKIANVKIS